jgi:hypothetical protein
VESHHQHNSTVGIASGYVALVTMCRWTLDGRAMPTVALLPSSTLVFLFSMYDIVMFIFVFFCFMILLFSSNITHRTKKYKVFDFFNYFVM